MKAVRPGTVPFFGGHHRRDGRGEKGDCPPCPARSHAAFLWDEPSEGAWNMALDEALLEAADSDGVSTLRFYRWSEPTLSLGYFQRTEERHEHRPNLGCPMVRRASGGGAILHDAELTYSLAIPTADRLAGAARGLVDTVHAAWVEALGSLGIETRIVNGAAEVGKTPFLCFQRHAPGDIMLGDAKIAGSAQRRHRGAILQHGSILLARSRFAPELPGLTELTGRQIDPRELANRFRERLCERIGFQCDREATSLSNGLAARAEEIRAAKFGAAEWTNRR